MPACEAKQALEKTRRDIPAGCFDEIALGLQRRSVKANVADLQRVREAMEDLGPPAKEAHTHLEAYLDMWIQH